eukprot:Rhum_TRINITY_DN15117_c0_g2::Rhum_TRINITY_DN15117_c0_g2_i3::g.138881::m.138881
MGVCRDDSGPCCTDTLIFVEGRSRCTFCCEGDQVCLTVGQCRVKGSNGEGVPMWMCFAAAVAAALIFAGIFLFLRRRRAQNPDEAPLPTGEALRALYPPSVSLEGDVLNPVFQYDGRPLYPVAGTTGRPVVPPHIAVAADAQPLWPPPPEVVSHPPRKPEPEHRHKHKRKSEPVVAGAPAPPPSYPQPTAPPHPPSAPTVEAVQDM